MNSSFDLTTSTGRLQYSFQEFSDCIERGGFNDRFSFFKSVDFKDEKLQTIFHQQVEKFRDIWIQNFIFRKSYPDNTEEFSTHFQPHISKKVFNILATILEIQKKYKNYQFTQTFAPRLSSSIIFLTLFAWSTFFLFSLMAIPTFLESIHPLLAISSFFLLYLVFAGTPIIFIFTKCTKYESNFNHSKISESYEILERTIAPLAARHVQLLMKVALIPAHDGSVIGHFKDGASATDLVAYEKILRNEYRKLYLDSTQRPLTQRSVSLQPGNPLPEEILLIIFRLAANPRVAETSRDNRKLMKELSKKFDFQRSHLLTRFNVTPCYLFEASLISKKTPVVEVIKFTLNLERLFQMHVCPRDWIPELPPRSMNFGSRSATILDGYTLGDICNLFFPTDYSLRQIWYIKQKYFETMRHFGFRNEKIQGYSFDITKRNFLFIRFNLYNFFKSPSLKTFNHFQEWLLKNMNFFTSEERTNELLSQNLRKFFSIFFRAQNIDSPTSIPENLEPHPLITEIKIPYDLGLTRIPEEIGFFQDLQTLEIWPQLVPNQQFNLSMTAPFLHLPDTLWTLPNLERLTFKLYNGTGKSSIVIPKDILQLKSLQTLDLRGAIVLNQDDIAPTLAQLQERGVEVLT